MEKNQQKNYVQYVPLTAVKQEKPGCHCYHHGLHSPGSFREEDQNDCKVRQNARNVELRSETRSRQPVDFARIQEKLAKLHQQRHIDQNRQAKTDPGNQPKVLIGKSESKSNALRTRARVGIHESDILGDQCRGHIQERIPARTSAKYLHVCPRKEITSRYADDQ